MRIPLSKPLQNASQLCFSICCAHAFYTYAQINNTLKPASALGMASSESGKLSSTFRNLTSAIDAASSAFRKLASGVRKSASSFRKSATAIELPSSQFGKSTSKLFCNWFSDYRRCHSEPGRRFSEYSKCFFKQKC